MPLFRKIQLIAVAAGGVLTQVIGLGLVFDVINWSGDQVGAVGLTYTTLVGFVVVTAQALSGVEPTDSEDGA